MVMVLPMRLKQVATLPIPIDTDNDGLANLLDLDSDNDGIPDAFEAGQMP